MSKVLKVIADILIIAFIVAAAAIFVPPLFGVTTAVATPDVTTNMSQGTVAYGQRVPLEELASGDTIIYSGDDYALLCEVQAVDLDSDIVTVNVEGTAQQIQFHNSAPRSLFTIPFIGYMSIALQSFEGLIILALIAALIVALFIVAEVWSKRDKEEREYDNMEEEEDDEYFRTLSRNAEVRQENAENMRNSYTAAAGQQESEYDAFARADAGIGGYAAAESILDLDTAEIKPAVAEHSEPEGTPAFEDTVDLKGTRDYKDTPAASAAEELFASDETEMSTDQGFDAAAAAAAGAAAGMAAAVTKQDSSEPEPEIKDDSAVRYEAVTESDLKDKDRKEQKDREKEIKEDRKEEKRIEKEYKEKDHKEDDRKEDRKEDHKEHDRKEQEERRFGQDRDEKQDSGAVKEDKEQAPVQPERTYEQKTETVPESEQKVSAESTVAAVRRPDAYEGEDFSDLNESEMEKMESALETALEKAGETDRTDHSKVMPGKAQDAPMEEPAAEIPDEIELAVPVRTLEEILQDAYSKGEDPHIRKDSVTGITLVDFSESFR